MKKSNLVIIGIIIAVFGVVLFFGNGGTNSGPVVSTEQDKFAACIAESGAQLYGAWWCPHCEDQREMFGESEPLLPYIECSLPNSRSQNLRCKNEDIQVYPTWKFADGSVVESVLSFEQLSQATNCPLPGEEAVISEITSNEDAVSESSTTTDQTNVDTPTSTDPTITDTTTENTLNGSDETSETSTPEGQ